MKNRKSVKKYMFHIISEVIITIFLLYRMTLCAYAEEYEYDDLNRLVKVVYEDGSSIKYTYDDNGNLLQTVVELGKNKDDGKEPETDTGGDIAGTEPDHGNESQGPSEEKDKNDDKNNGKDQGTGAGNDTTGTERLDQDHNTGNSSGNGSGKDNDRKPGTGIHTETGDKTGTVDDGKIPETEEDLAELIQQIETEIIDRYEKGTDLRNEKQDLYKFLIDFLQSPVFSILMWLLKSFVL